jgi:hypothetical protein
MLSQHERRTLADIEEHLREVDPNLAHRLEHGYAGASSRHSHIRHAIGLAGLLLSALLFAAALLARNADAAVLAVTVLLADVAWWTTLAGIALAKSRMSAGRIRQRR